MTRTGMISAVSEPNLARGLFVSHETVLMVSPPSAVGCKNRIGATRHPSGGSDMINRIERRPSQTEDTGVKKMMHHLLHLPAY